MTFFSHRHKTIMTTIYLHIGTHKTGTTAIQRALFECRADLDAQNVLVPLSCHAMGSSHQLAWSLLPFNPPWYPVSSLSRDELFARLGDEITVSSPAKVILSSEDFSLVDAAEGDACESLKALQTALSQWEVKVVVYLRPQSDFLTAFYNQVHKDNDPRFKDKTVSGLMASLHGVLNYDLLLQRWSSVFGAENLIVKPFNKFRETGDIAHGFFRACGIDLADIPEIRTNESLDPELLAFRKMANKFQGGDASKAALEHVLSAVSRPVPAPLFTRSEAMEIVGGYATGNQQILSNYSNVQSSDFDPVNFLSDETANELERQITWQQSAGVLSVMLGETIRDNESRFSLARKELNKLLTRLQLEQAELNERQGRLDMRTEHIALAAFCHSKKTFSPRRVLRKLLRSDTTLIKKSGCFDVEYYLADNPDVLGAGIDPVAHYLRYGAMEGRNPSLSFSTVAYLADNMDVALAGINPLVHAIRHGGGFGTRKLERQEYRDGFYRDDCLREIRQQSRLGRHVVVIDHEIPLFDTNAGARHSFQYMKLLVDLGVAVTFLPFTCSDEDNSSQKKVMINAGINVLEHDDCFTGGSAPNAWISWLNHHQEQIDLVFIHRPHVAKAYMDACKRLGLPVWYMCHDLHFLRTRRQAQIEKSLKLWLYHLKVKKQEKAVFSRADVSFTPSTFEEDYVKRNFGLSNVVTLPLYIYEAIDLAPRRMPSGKKITFVGSFGHDPNVDAVRWFVNKVFPLILKHHPDAEFNVVGANPPESLLAMAKGNIVFHGYLSDPDLEALYAKTRVVAIPLRYGAGVKGKVIEAMVMGIPFVSTKCGIEGVGPLNGLVDPQDRHVPFADEVNRLLEMGDESDALISAGLKELANERFSLSAAESLLKPLLDRCVG